MSGGVDSGGAGAGEGDGSDGRPPSSSSSSTRRGAWTDGRAIVEAMQRGESGAFTAFVERYQRLLLHYGKRAALSDEATEDLVQNVLGDAAVELVAPGHGPAADPTLLLISRFRSRFLNLQRADERHARRVHEASTELDGEERRAALCSEHAVRASHGPDWDPPPPLAAGLGTLARMLSASLRDDERQMLAWDSEDVPQREIAERLGITHNAVRQRLRRLKERLRASAERYAAGLDGDGGRVVRRFLRRSMEAPRSPGVAREGTPNERARPRRAEPGPLADGSSQEPRRGSSDE
ncbi:MAG TPA: sigma-70 family RNA polymerase sigma factor [Gemmatimonadaceae bacterium]|nr:sigma-70 family RNA polymerase sigma factor [Gemmatimonadaceae bacterium]